VDKISEKCGQNKYGAVYKKRENQIKTCIRMFLDQYEFPKSVQQKTGL